MVDPQGDDKLEPSEIRTCLQRWPRCSSVHVTVSRAAGPSVTTAGDGNAASLLLPFSHMSPEGRLRITHVTCVARRAGFLEAHPIISLTTWLPSLRELRLHDVRLACDPQQLALMYGALAGLKRLEVLTLPSCQALEGIGALGSSGSSSLRRLEVWDEEGRFSNVPATRPGTLTGLSQLHGLQHLTYVGHWGRFDLRHETCVGFLTASLPPSLRLLEIRKADLIYDCTPTLILSMDVQQGQLCAVHVSHKQSLTDMLWLVSKVLLPRLPVGEEQSRRLAQALMRLPPLPQQQHRPQPADVQQGVLHIESLWFSHGELTQEQLEALSQLRRHFCDISLGALHLLACAVQQDAVEQLRTAIKLTQALATPRVLQLQMSLGVPTNGRTWRCPTISFKMDTGSESPDAVSQEAPQSPPTVHESSPDEEEEDQEPAADGPVANATDSEDAQNDSTVGVHRQLSSASVSEDTATSLPNPTAADLLRAALDRMVQSAAGPGPDKDTIEGVAAVTQSASVFSLNRTGERLELVLLRGPFIESLCHARGPELAPWLRLVEEQLSLAEPGAAGAAEPSAPGVPGAGGTSHTERKRVYAYQLVPCAGALLIACEERVTPALAAAAAKAVTLHEAAVSPAAGPEGVAAAPEVSPLGIKWTWAPDNCLTLTAPMQDWLLYHFAQALQSAWARMAAACKARVAGDALTYLATNLALRLREELQLELPPPVALHCDA